MVHWFGNMINLIWIFLAAAILNFAAGTAYSANSFSETQKKEIETLIQSYILKNPEIITQAFKVLQTREREAEEKRTKVTLVSLRSRLFEDLSSPVGGNLNGDITVIEFFDYRCGVCKRIHPIVEKLIKTDQNIRRIYKEWPILGADSVIAARAALASHRQGGYTAFHNAMMEARARLNRHSIMAIARRVGLDTERLTRDMDSPEIKGILKRNSALAEALKLTGTPSFVIEDTLLFGGHDLATMKSLVHKARAKKN